MTELDELRLALIRADVAERRMDVIRERAQRAVNTLANTEVPAEERVYTALVIFAETTGNHV